MIRHRNEEGGILVASRFSLFSVGRWHGISCRDEAVPGFFLLIEHDSDRESHPANPYESAREIARCLVDRFETGELNGLCLVVPENSPAFGFARLIQLLLPPALPASITVDLAEAGDWLSRYAFSGAISREDRR